MTFLKDWRWKAGAAVAVLLGMSASPLWAATPEEQCQATVAQYMVVNHLAANPEEKSQAISVCVAGLTNAFTVLENATQKVMGKCSETLTAFQQEKGIPPVGTAVWTDAMNQCMQGNENDAKAALWKEEPTAPAMANTPNVVSPPMVLEAAPRQGVETQTAIVLREAEREARELQAKAAARYQQSSGQTASAPAAPSGGSLPPQSGGNIPSVAEPSPPPAPPTVPPEPVVEAAPPVAPAPPQAAQTGGNIPGEAPSQQRGGTVDLRGGQVRCLPIIDAYVKEKGLTPSGSAFQKAVDLCAIDQLDAAYFRLTQADDDARAKCKPILEQYVAENSLGTPSRMAWTTAMDLCTNSKLTEAKAELSKTGEGRRAPSEPVLQPPPLPTATSKPSKDAVTGEPGTSSSGGTVRSGERNTVVTETGSRADCSAQLNEFVTANSLSPTTVALSNAVNMCTDGRLDSAKREVQFSSAEVVATCDPILFKYVKEHNLSPSKTWWTGAKRLCGDGKTDEAFKMLSNSEKKGERASEAEKMGGETLAPVAERRAQPKSAAPPKEESCALRLDRFVQEKALAPSRAGYQEALSACDSGRIKDAETSLLNSHARTMNFCDPILKSRLQSLGIAKPEPEQWSRALNLCANGKVDEAKGVFQ